MLRAFFSISLFNILAVFKLWIPFRGNWNKLDLQTSREDLRTEHFLAHHKKFTTSLSLFLVYQFWFNVYNVHKLGETNKILKHWASMKVSVTCVDYLKLMMFEHFVLRRDPARVKDRTEKMPYAVVVRQWEHESGIRNPKNVVHVGSYRTVCHRYYWKVISLHNV